MKNAQNFAQGMSWVLTTSKLPRWPEVTLIVFGNKMHQCGVEVRYFGHLLSSGMSNYGDGDNNDSLLMMQTGKVAEALDFDFSLTRLVVVEETG
jgi:hypothetical protein